MYISKFRANGEEKMTLTQLAKLAHVSVSTASKAFSMSPEVNEETRKIIFDIAKQHDCFKKYYNANYPKLVIAIICPDMTSSSGLIKNLQSRLSEYNCEICATASGFSTERERELVEYYENYVKVDGIILLSPHSIPPADIEAHVAVIDPYDESVLDCEDVIVAMRSVDNACEEAIDHFISRGITDIAFIGDRRSSSKLELFEKFITEKLGSVDRDKISISDDITPRAGYEAINVFLDRGYVPRAVISAHFNCTVGATKAVFQRGLKIPEDVAMISFGNSGTMEFVSPSLTGVDSYDYECCIRVADSLINKINGQSYEKNIFFNSAIKYRRSSEIDI